jgi:hypothetical protein
MHPLVGVAGEPEAVKPGWLLGVACGALPVTGVKVRWATIHGVTSMVRIVRTSRRMS